MEEEEEEKVKNFFPVPNPMLWFTNIIILQADIFHDCFLVLLSPFIFLYSLIPKTIILLKKVVFGFLGATYVCTILLVLLVVAVILGVGVVQIWSDEPVLLKQRLYFDYTEIHPTAVFAFDGDEGFECSKHLIHFKQQHQRVPVGHTFYISLVFLMPESDYNREIGMFQVTAEVISTNGNIMAKSSHPCMLRFRSWPIKMMRIFVLWIPLLLGITAETQRMKLTTLMHREGFPRTEAIRISLVPRSGTNFLPQFYEAEMVLRSQLPWGKELVRRWKWTCYVWASLYAYVMLIMVLLCCFKPLTLPVKARSINGGNSTGKAKSEEGSRSERRLSETLRRCQESRNRRKAMVLHGDDIESPEPLGSSATSMSLTREDTGPTWEDDDDVTDAYSTGDSGSVCYKGDVDVNVD